MLTFDRKPRARGGQEPAAPAARRLQAKLTVNQPGDEQEREADRVAEEVTRGGAASVSPSAPPGEVRRSGGGEGPAEAPASVHETLRSPGRPLETRLRERFESRFGFNFGSVRIHPDSPSARDVSARAYTVGSHIAFAPGELAPGTGSGDRLLAHELTHVVQQAGAPVRLQRDDKKKDDETDEPNPIADWKLSDGSIVLIRTESQTIVIPGGKLVWTPDSKAQTAFEASKGHLATDLGTLFEVPATGASGTRIFKAGKRTALILDAGSNPMRAVPGAVYLSEFQAVLANLSLTKLERLQVIHVHKDHVSEIASLVGQYNIRPQDLIIPAPYVGVNRDIRQVVTALQTTTDAALITAGYGPTWNPGTKLKDQGGPGDVFRYSYKVGDLVVENVALRSALSTTARNPDLASYLTKVTRTTDQAKVVVLGDLRGADLDAIRTAMESAKSGSWAEFFSGVTTLSGFSHHVGAAKDADVAGLVNLLDVTLLRNGKLRVVEQTNTAEHAQARADTIEAVRRLGIELVTTEMPSGAGPSAAGASKSTISSRGPSGTTYSPVNSDLTAALGRIERLIGARRTIETWRPWFEEAGGKQAVEDILPQIDRSISDLQQAARGAAQATLQVRTGGNKLTSGGRDYSTATGGTRATTLDTALRAIPATTAAETSLGTKGFNFLDELRNRPEKDIPLAVALHAAMTRGEYSEKAFRYMLASLDPATRDSLLLDPRGGPSAKVKTFERVRATFGFRSSVLGTGEILAVPSHYSAGAKAATRGVGGFLAFLEIFNSLIVPGVQAYQTGQRIFSSRNLLPFVRRLLFWQQAGVAPKAVGVDEGITDQTYEKDYAKVVKGLNDQSLDALYFEEPVLSDVDVFKFGVWLSYNVRNFDEFAVLFKDSGQDAVTWETPDKGDWRKAVWKVRAGRYETSGENHVEESWYEHPKLTELMRAMAGRIISNTDEILKAGSASEERDNRIGYLTGYEGGRHGTRAKLATAAETTEVEVETFGNERQSRLKRTVRWWSPPEFYVEETRGDEARVKGADYNTYANLRGLETENRILGLGASGTTHDVTVAGNLAGSVWIHLSLLEGIGVPLRKPAPKGALSPVP